MKNFCKKYLGLIGVLLFIAVVIVSHFTAAAAAAAVIAQFPFAGSPQDKMLDQFKKSGLNNMKYNQGTSRIIYDTLEIVPGQDYYYFFRDSNTRTFPQTNLGSFGNKLEVGESLTILWGYLNIYTFKPATEELNEVYTVNNILTYPKILLGEYSMSIGNSQVIKPIRILEWSDQFNKNSQHQYNEVYHFNNVLVIEPLLEFLGIVRIVPFTSADFVKGTKTFLQLTLEGVGSIFAPRKTF